MPKKRIWDEPRQTGYRTPTSKFPNRILGRKYREEKERLEKLASGDISIFFEYDDRVVQIPVNPEEIKCTIDGNNDTVEVVKLGEINLIKDRKLTSISFESFFPKFDWFPSIRTTGEFKDCDFYKKFFLKIMRDKKPCRFVVTGIDFNSFLGDDKLVTVEKFEVEHKAGEHEDAYYSIELKEYKEHDIATVEVIKKDKKKKNKNKKDRKKDKKPGKITRGCTVIVNGRLHRDSNGNGPGITEKNAVRKINFIQKGKKCPYHVTTLSGGWRGWVTAKSVTLKK